MKARQIEDQRETGRRLVLATIRSHERVARIDIARATSLSPATVTTITGELLCNGLIEEVAPTGSKSDAKRGRPRVDLKIRGQAHLVAGLKLADKNATVALMDFEGGLQGEYTQRFPQRTLGQNEVLDFIEDLLKQATAQIGLKPEDLSGVGIGLAGVIDARRGFVHWSPTLKERNLPLRPLLEDKIPLPFFIDNDVNLVALAEQWFGLGRNVNNFVVVTIEQGVGMGIVIDGKIYRGARGCGAEFGHTKVHLEGALCRCGQRGCLEAYVADYALLREANLSASASGTDNADQQVSALFYKAKAGDRTAQSIFRRAGKMFALGLANVVNIFDPGLIILSGERMQFDYLYAGEVIENMKSSVVQIDVPPPEVRIHKWGDLMWAKGAAVFAMEAVTELALEGLTSDVG